jgi:hypothetical protein
LSQDSDYCSGNIEDCVHGRQAQDCRESGGTIILVQFYPSERFAPAKSGLE